MKPGQVHQRGWYKQAIDGNGKRLSSIRVVCKPFFKKFEVKKVSSGLPFKYEATIEEAGP